jgi:hypothetical protein
MWFNKNHQLHRENNLPAVIYSDFTKEYWINGEEYWENGQKIIFNDKTKNPVIDNLKRKMWFNDNNQLHRDDDLPAIVWINGTKEWYINGIRCRKNGPAIEMNDGTIFWYEDGLCSRNKDLPAIEYKNGTKQYWINGVEISERKIILNNKLKNELFKNKDIIKKFKI